MDTEAETSAIVFVRRRWNTPEVAQVRVDEIWNLHFRDEPGGVCRALPRAFLCAHVWCDKLQAGTLAHNCRSDPPAPHELLVCILPTDNAAAVYEGLRARARG
jgi:hypothetical protein